MKVRGIEQDLISYVGQLDLASVPIEEWIIDPDVYGLPDGFMTLYASPAYSGKVFHPGVMTFGAVMVIAGGRNPEMFLAKRSLHILLCTPHYTLTCDTCTCKLLCSSV